jgi:thioredoxin 1
MASEKIVHLNSSTFDDTIRAAKTPVLVDFWAAWCGPCRAIAPILEDLASEFAGKLKVAKVNVDDNQDLAVRYSIHSIPTLLVFRDGKEVERLIGALPKGQIKNKIQSILA